MTTYKSELDELCEKHEITAIFEEGGALTEGWPGAAKNWRVTISRGRRVCAFSCDFFGGSAISSPTVADVVSALCLDVTTFEDEDSFDALGFSATSAVRFYKRMVDLAPEIRNFFGDLFNELSQAEH